MYCVEVPITGKVMIAKAPFATEDMVAVTVRGYSMGAIRDGWLIYFRHRESKPVRELQDELCIVKTRCGRILLRFLKRGRLPERWDLLSVTGEPMMDVELMWAERVEFIRPHKLSEEDIEALNEIPSGELRSPELLNAA